MTRDQDALGLLLDLDPTDRTAVEWCRHELTYALLDSAVDALARLLVARGAPRTHVLLLGPLCPAYVVGLLATLRCGAVPVPVDAGMTADQYAWAERAARPSTILTSDLSTVAHYQGAGAADEVVLDAATGRVILDTSAGRRSGTAWRYSEQDAGYLIPTSGSTGAAKAIVGSRTGLNAFLSWFVGEFTLDDQDICAAVTRVNFDPSLRELLSVLVVGGRLCLPEVDAQLDLRALRRHFIGSKATIAFLVPSLARRIAEVLRAESIRLDRLRLGFFAGEVLSSRVVEQWAEIAPDAEFVNLYGMTEGTLAQLYRRGVRPGSGGRSQGIPVGRPRPGVSVAIDRADGEGHGEVVIGSSAPALGMLTGGPGPEPGTFQVDPMAPELRTGDLGCWTDHGELVIVGRLGNDLKVSGRRVSFHRFADLVEDLPEVDQCIVVGRQGLPHAFATVAELAPDREERLRERIRGVARRLGLPRPTVHLRRELPLLRSGKVDRVALTASIEDSPTVDAASVGRDAGTAEVLLGLLGLGAGVAASTSFVDAGVSSLDMTEFVLGVNRRFGLSLSARDCFEHRDVASLALAIERTGRPAAPSAAPPGDRQEDTTGGRAAYPLSTRQVAYMATCMADGNANWCNLSREIRIERVVTAAEVAAAVDGLVARHDALRLSLSADWSQLIHSGAADLRYPITVHEASDAGSETDAEYRARVQEARARAVSPPIDPTAAPPLRVAVVRSGGRSSVLLVAHHLFADGLSMDLIAGEVRSALLGQRIGSGPPRQGYRSYCLATRRTSETPTPDAEYWRALLRGAEQIELPEAVSDDARSGELLSRPFGVGRSREARRLAAAAGVSVFSVVLAAFDLAVSRTFGLRPLTIVVPVQIREGVRNATAGMFMSQLIVRGGGSASLPDNAREFARQLDQGAARSSWEFDQRVGELGLAGSDCFPLTTVLFNQHPKERGLRVRDLGSWQPRALGRTLRYQVQGELHMSGSEMALTYYYRRGIAGDGTGVIDRIHAHVLAALSSAGRTLNAE
ncbi:AMP-binding protein [Peterkaempfera bronchialis]|uniref:AMP-binding protein n=1 Tax=Peterkaempfera bronchialis TaxID=2126346 RepID=UPI003C2AFB1C